MPRSLEERRRAVAAALRALESESRELRADVRATSGVEARLDRLAGQMNEMLQRMAAVETNLLESAWERPAATKDETPGTETVEATGGGDDEEAPGERLSVPALPLAEGRLSRVAARALFGD